MVHGCNGRKPPFGYIQSWKVCFLKKEILLSFSLFFQPTYATILIAWHLRECFCFVLFSLNMHCVNVWSCCYSIQTMLSTIFNVYNILFLQIYWSHRCLFLMDLHFISFMLSLHLEFDADKKIKKNEMAQIQLEGPNHRLYNWRNFHIDFCVCPHIP